MEPCSEKPWKFDIGIQCCFGPITLKNESTQTDCVNDAPPTANVRSNYVDDDGNDDDDEDLDPSWQLPNDKKSITEDDNLPSVDEFEGNSNTPDCEKFLVSDSCLSTLLKRCPECGDVIAQCDRKTTGSLLSVQLTCHSDHMINWDSQPVVKRKPLGNLLLAASILFTGNTFAAINRLASCLNLQFFSESVFYDT